MTKAMRPMSKPVCPNCGVPRYPAYGACYACGKPFVVEESSGAP